MVDWLKSGVPKPKPNSTPTTPPKLDAHTIRSGWNVDTVYFNEAEVGKGGMVQTYQDKEGRMPGKIIPASKLRK